MIDIQKNKFKKSYTVDDKICVNEKEVKQHSNLIIKCSIFSIQLVILGKKVRNRSVELNVKGGGQVE